MMEQVKTSGPGAAATASGSGIAGVSKLATAKHKPSSRKLAISFDGPRGPDLATGKDARALVALVQAGARGVTTLELSHHWALRLGAYIFNLRHRNGLAIETIREPHDNEGGWHGRYVLHSPVTIRGRVA